MFILCPECRQHYDDTERAPQCPGVGTSHKVIGVRPVDERIATYARVTYGAMRASAVGTTP